MVNPATVLPSFQRALRQGVISVTPSPANASLYRNQDLAEGTPRLTYVRLQKKNTVTALVMIVREEPIDDVPTFAIGYAVPPLFRKKGLATDLVRDAIADFKIIVAKSSVNRFYLEAIIEATNAPSLKIANKLLSNTPELITEEASGKPAFRYIGEFTAA